LIRSETMNPTGAASAPSVFAEATSKVPFYVAGGLLVCWALIVAALGSRRSAFPGSARAARLLMLGSVVLAAATMTSAVLTGSRPTAGVERPASTSANLAAQSGGALAYDTTHLTLRAGTDTIHFTNPSPVPHNVTIAAGSKVIAHSKTITNAATTLSAKLTPGTFVFFCSVDSHRQAGMQGTLTVR
jgi:plastocyanin